MSFTSRFSELRGILSELLSAAYWIGGGGGIVLGAGSFRFYEIHFNHPLQSTTLCNYKALMLKYKKNLPRKQH